MRQATRPSTWLPVPSLLRSKTVSLWAISSYGGRKQEHCKAPISHLKYNPPYHHNAGQLHAKSSVNYCLLRQIPGGEGGIGKYETKKPKIKYVGWEHTRVGTKTKTKTKAKHSSTAHLHNSEHTMALYQCLCQRFYLWGVNTCNITQMSTGCWTPANQKLMIVSGRISESPVPPLWSLLRTSQAPLRHSRWHPKRSWKKKKWTSNLANLHYNTQKWQSTHLKTHPPTSMKTLACLKSPVFHWMQPYDISAGTSSAVGGSKLENLWNKKTQINSVGWQHTRVDNNKTNKAQASHFCSSASGGGR